MRSSQHPLGWSGRESRTVYRNFSPIVRPGWPAFPASDSGAVEVEFLPGGTAYVPPDWPAAEIVARGTGGRVTLLLKEDSNKGPTVRANVAIFQRSWVHPCHLFRKDKVKFG